MSIYLWISARLLSLEHCAKSSHSSWEANTSLQPLDLDAIKKEVEAGNNTKKGRALWEAYEIAAQGNDLDYFKTMLQEHEQAMQIDQEEKEEVTIKKKEKGKRKSNAVDESEDVEMEDDGEVKKLKSSKKRKKDAESEGESEKVLFSIQTTLKAPD